MKKYFCVLLLLCAALISSACGAAEPEAPADTEFSFSYPETQEELESYYKSLEGKYYESSTGATTLFFHAEDPADPYIIIILINGKDTYTSWTMHVELTEDARLCYSDCVCHQVTEQIGSSDTIEDIYQNGSGYFSLGNFLLRWDGAEEEAFTGCIYER